MTSVEKMGVAFSRRLTEALYLMRVLEGNPHPDRSQLIAEAEVWMREPLANDTSDRRFR
jgi:hypothetical protein